MPVAKLQYSLVVSLALFMVWIRMLGLKTAKNSDEALNTDYKDRVVPMKQLQVIADMYSVTIVAMMLTEKISWFSGRDPTSVYPSGPIYTTTACGAGGM